MYFIQNKFRYVENCKRGNSPQKYFVLKFFLSNFNSTYIPNFDNLRSI